MNWQTRSPIPLKLFGKLLSATLLTTTFLVSALAPAARADDDAKINARIGVWGRNCKNAVAAKFPKAAMSDITVELGVTEKQSIDDGSTSLADIKKSGMSYNWEIRGKKVSGYCNVNGKGKITEFKQGI